jgi:hypothetical protein
VQGRFGEQDGVLDDCSDVVDAVARPKFCTTLHQSSRQLFLRYSVKVVSPCVSNVSCQLQSEEIIATAHENLRDITVASLCNTRERHR